MKDPRNDVLADILVNHSCRVKRGDMVTVAMKGVPSTELGKAIIKKITEVGGVPFWFFNDDTFIRQFLPTASVDQLKKYAQYLGVLIRKTDCYMSIAGPANSFDLADISSKQMAAYRKYVYTPLFANHIIKKTRWVGLRFPNDAMAQLAKKPQEVFENFFYDVCCIDYKKMSKAQDQLAALMEKTNKVHIKGPGTDLTFSIKDIPVIKCDGHHNIPDGEVFTAPVRNSINGVLSYNAPSLYEGTVYSDIRFEFKDGKIIDATCSSNHEKLNKVLDSDTGSRYIGEFALGVNPMIKEPMMDTLFDEKIDGSFHITPGRCYDDAPNGNKSSIHWDLVNIQRSDYGGGEIWFDDVLIRKNGKFTLPKLKGKFTAKALRK